jgi:hypothetical protein
MTEPLSPAAQAVRHAAICAGPELEGRIAAALRAAADQMVLMRPHGGQAWTVEQVVAHTVLQDALTKASDLLNAIAAELEGGNG